MDKIKFKEKCIDLSIFFLFYLISYVSGYFSSFHIENIILRLFVFDIISTVIIYFFSLIIKNSSLYDVYWSLTPLVMLTYLIILNNNNLNIYHYILYIVFSFWSIRLTINWIITFENRKWIDWRYQDLKAKSNKYTWQFINFFGIMMMPTLLVFVAFIPLIYAININLNAFSLIGSFIILIGTLLELFSDHYMHKFLKSNHKNEVVNIGLWKYSRHPNYLGEILIWIGVYLVVLLSAYEYWYLFVGMLLIILLFNFISIPLAEKRQLSKRSTYKEYQLETSRLLIIPKKKNKKAVQKPFFFKYLVFKCKYNYHEVENKSNNISHNKTLPTLNLLSQQYFNLENIFIYLEIIKYLYYDSKFYFKIFNNTVTSLLILINEFSS